MQLIFILSVICLLLSCGLLMFTIYMRMRIQQMIEDYQNETLMQSEDITRQVNFFISLIEKENDKNKTLQNKGGRKGKVGGQDKNGGF